MSISPPKPGVSPAMLATRLGDMFYVLSGSVEKSLASMNRVGMGKSIYQTIKTHTDCLVAFSMEHAVRLVLKEDVAADVIEGMSLPIQSAHIELYRKRFNDDPISRRLAREYLMSGVVFQELCGSTGNREVDELVRQFGEQTFVTIFDMVKDEINSVRLCE